MKFDVNIDGFNEDDIGEAFVKAAEKQFRDYIENELSNGEIECECGSRSFDIETWKTADGDIEAAGICRSCNDRIEIDVDTSELEELR